MKKLSEKGKNLRHRPRHVEREYEIRARETRAAEFALKVAEFEFAQAKAGLIQFPTPDDGTVVEVRSPVSGFVLLVMQESAAFVDPAPRSSRSAIVPTSKSRPKSSRAMP